MNGRLLVSGGGTGGHILAGVAVAEAWTEKWSPSGPEASVLFVGAAGGIEEKLVPRAGFPLEVLKMGALNRVSTIQKLKTFLQLPIAFLKSAVILLQFRPSVILGVGGYSSGPMIAVAKVLQVCRILSVRIGILEQNAVPGMTNRWLGKLADIVFTAFPGTDRHFPGRKVVLTGNPVRSSMRAMDSAVRDPFTVFIFGGSQGAVGINSLVLGALPFLRPHLSRMKFIHQTGEKDYSRVVQEYKKLGVDGRIEKFIHEMPKAYEESSILICRSGSSTLSEISAVGRASILIPLPTAADNHQEKNARVFSEQGAAVLLSQRESTGPDLANLILSFMEKPTQIAAMEKAVRSMHRPRAAEDIVESLIGSSHA